MDGPQFCSNCGYRLSPGVRFCASCGKQMQKDSEPMQPQPAAVQTPAAAQPYAVSTQQSSTAAPAQETVHAILPGAARHSGFLGLKVESFIIVATNLRLLFALQTTEMMKENIKNARLEAEQEGKGFFGKWGAQFKANNGKQYLQMPPMQILAEHPENYSINREQLRSIRLREEVGDENSTSTYIIQFETGAGKQQFRFASLNIRETKKLFQQLYGNIVR